MAIEITDSNFEEMVTNSEKPVVLDFWATWCGPCRIIAPIIDELSDEFKDKAVIGKVNVDENAEVTAKFGIRNIPTVLFIKNGEVEDKVVGATSKNVLTEKLNSLF